MRHKKKRELEKPDENWLISYADMMTLLLYLFVVLYAMAVLNKGNLEEPMKTFSNSFINSGIINIFDKTGQSTIPSSQNSAYNAIQKYMKDNNLKDQVSTSQMNNGISLDLKVELLFDTGSSIIKPESEKILDKISLLLKKMPNDITIKGYTDNLPISSSHYPSNWELSSDRAVKILRYFTEECGLNSNRFTAEGKGENDPVASNKTAEGRQKNRRVEIFIVYNDANSN